MYSWLVCLASNKHYRSYNTENTLSHSVSPLGSLLFSS
ncbi:hypothetical protein [Aeromonas phage Akh-2]|nr:hypothetical protein [Aeromonas phage Akh-2]